MVAYKTEVILDEDQSLTLRGLPFRPGAGLEVIVLERQGAPVDHSDEASELSRYPLRGSVLRYDDPCEPVGAEDWEAPQ